jgi:hypothetical protein
MPLALRLWTQPRRVPSGCTPAVARDGNVWTSGWCLVACVLAACWHVGEDMHALLALSVVCCGFDVCTPSGEKLKSQPQLLLDPLVHASGVCSCSTSLF